jgi:glycosyltransferase involved in cell wall biosynthesis
MKSRIAQATHRIQRTLSPHVSVKIKTAAYRLADSAKFARLALARKFVPIARMAGLRRAQQGVNLVASIRAEMGQGTAARGIASALEAARIPFGVINLPYDIPSRHDDMTWAHKEVEKSNYDITVVSTTPDNFRNVKLRTPTRTLANGYVIANWFWELPEIPEAWLTAFEIVNEVWAPSRFIQDAVSLKSPVPVIRVPPVVELPQGCPFSREHFALPSGRFLFLGMFDTWSVIERKNPSAVLQAFISAFPQSSKEVALVLKFNNPEHQRPAIEALRETVQDRDDIYFFDTVMTRAEMNSLLAAADCLVSLHRSEGFGYGPAEAMSLNKPVIITNWSGNTDYMTRDNCVAIDYKLVRLDRDYGPYEAHQHWAEPDVEQAAFWMRRLFEDPQLARAIGARGCETIRAEFSPAAVGGLISKRFSYIRRNV